MLVRYGADHFSFSESRDMAEVGFVFGALAVRMRVPIKPMTDEAAVAYARKTRSSQAKALQERPEREARRVWRVLFWLLKTRMEAIEAGVETFQEAFLAHLLDPRSDMTVMEAMLERGAMKQLEVGVAE